MAKEQNYKEILQISTANLHSLLNQKLHLISLGKPRDRQQAIGLSRVVSKLSPIIGNLLEYEVASTLNTMGNLPHKTEWVRQDPGFPDTILKGFNGTVPGIEIKTWYPLATEITARFRETQSHLTQGNVQVAVICWIPEKILFGQPQIIGVWTDDAFSLAKARDDHYHKPPLYVVLEPEDTSSRTVNLQQTNCNGYSFQGSEKQFEKAKNVIKKWSKSDLSYKTDGPYQKKLRKLISTYKYRLDTNFAKIDRIQHWGLEKFKEEMLKKKIHGRTIQEWSDKLNKDDTEIIDQILTLN